MSLSRKRLATFQKAQASLPEALQLGKNPYQGRQVPRMHLSTSKSSGLRRRASTKACNQSFWGVWRSRNIVGILIVGLAGQLIIWGWYFWIGTILTNYHEHFEWI
jgi:hypothetical protein